MPVSGMKTHRHVFVFLFALACMTLVFLLCPKIQRFISVETRAAYLRSAGYWVISADPIDSVKKIFTGQTVPSCSLRRTVKQVGYLKTRFNFSVPVLQWAGSFNQSEWQRLQYAPLPFGWRELSPEVVKQTLSLLQNSSNSRMFERDPPDKCVRCAVVGNGGILNGSRQGKAIDSHDYIFRVNGAITKGFEEDVGTKTSFYGFTTNTLKHSLKAYNSDGFTTVPQQPGICYVFIPANVRDYMMLSAAIQGVTVPSGFDQGDWPSKYFGHKPHVKRFRMIHPNFIEYITRRFLNSPLTKMGYSDVYMPSTGAIMLLAAVHVCDQVSAFGFITPNYKDFSDHYYDAVKKPLLFYANHDMQMEKQLWELLHTYRVIWLYQRDGKK